jgi:aminopeptidase 2
MLAGTGVVNIQARELLPTNVVPRHYDITLEPDFEKFTFDGTVAIDLDVAEDSQSISLHTLELDIHNAKVSSAEGAAIASVSGSIPSSLTGQLY